VILSLLITYVLLLITFALIVKNQVDKLFTIFNNMLVKFRYKFLTTPYSQPSTNYPHQNTQFNLYNLTVR